MPILAERRTGSDRRRQESSAHHGIDRRRLSDQRRPRHSRVAMSDAEWQAYLAMPNLLEITVNMSSSQQMLLDDLEHRAQNSG